MLRIDELAELGCCCFCSILFIGNETFISENPDKVKAFMRAVKAANDLVLSDPAKAFADYADFKPEMNTALNRKMFERSFAYFSKDLYNVPRDWNKVTKYAKRLDVVPADFEPNYTNHYCDWEAVEDEMEPLAKQKKIAEIQEVVSQKGGVFSGFAGRSERDLAPTQVIGAAA